MSKNTMAGISLEDLLAGTLSAEQGGRSYPDNDAQVATLTEIAERYNAHWQVGDVITPRPGFSIKGEGRPAVVIETFDGFLNRASPAVGSDDNQHAPGVRYDIRFIVYASPDQLVAYVGESWQYELWSDYVARQKEKQDADKSAIETLAKVAGLPADEERVSAVKEALARSGWGKHAGDVKIN